MEIKLEPVEAECISIKRGRGIDFSLYVQGRNRQGILILSLSYYEAKQLALDLLNEFGLEEDLYEQVEKAL